MLRGFIAACLLLIPAVAHAKWLEASSGHFIVYADDKPQNVRRFSEQLERFHAAMTVLLKADATLPSPSNRVTIYVVNNDAQVRKLAGDKTSLVYAFYVPRAGGSLAFVPHVDSGKGDLDFSMIALLHEYTHHFTLSMSDTAMPEWMVEGVAEFFASAKFDPNGDVYVGRPAEHRYGELLFAKNVSAAQLLDPAHYKRATTPRDYDEYYGKSWLLFHYLMFSKPRAGQLAAYLRAVNGGKSSAEAAKAIFGDLGKLEGELETYLQQSTMMTIRMPAAGLEVGPINMRELSAGEAAMMPLRMRSKRGVDRKQALDLLPEAQRVAAAYPADAAVLSELAEAEHDAGNYDASIAAADRALALDPKQVNAYVQKGYSLFDEARDAKDKKAAYAAARAPFLALNQLENDHPLPLVYYYLSFVWQDLPPGDTGVAALRRAVELAPFDTSLRWMLAVQALRDGHADEAIANLKPLAYNPHAGKAAEIARTIIARIEAGAKYEDLRKEGLVGSSRTEDAAAN